LGIIRKETVIVEFEILCHSSPGEAEKKKPQENMKCRCPNNKWAPGDCKSKALRVEPNCSV